MSVFQTAVNQGIRSGDSFFISGIDSILEFAKSTLFVTKPVRDLLFEGYQEKILDTAKDIGIVVPYDKFGWFYPVSSSLLLFIFSYVYLCIH